MTEDEKKIQEMAQLGTMDCHGKDCIKCQQDHPHEICWPYRRAKMYYQEGYRKEEEVRKEILREVISFIKENRYCTIDDELIEEAYKRFGVEAEDKEYIEKAHRKE